MIVFDFRAIAARLKREPMLFSGRISSDETDRGYDNFRKMGGPGRHIRIMLDGVEQKDVDVADTVEGVVRRCLHDDSGNIFAIGDQIAQETVHGKVEIKIVTVVSD